MATRAEMVERVAAAAEPHMDDMSGMAGAAPAILDAVLPQVSTVEELEALPKRAVVLTDRGIPWERYKSGQGGHGPLRWRDSQGIHALPSENLVRFGTLTVVWQP